MLRRLAIPAGVGLFCNTLFNLTDTFFAGRLSTASLAGLSISFPVFFGIISVGAGLGAGTTALIAHAIGRGDIPRARLLAAQSLSFAVLASLVLAALGFLFARPLFRGLGAEGEYLSGALAYIEVIFAGAVFFVGSYAVNAGLVARGDTRSLRNVLAVGALLNIGLDPWFMWGGLGVPAMGLRGIGFSTILIQAGGLVYLVRRAARAGLLDRKSLGCCIPKAEPFRRIFGQGAPAALNHLSIGIGIYIITYFAARFGDGVVAAYGAATRVEQVVLLPVLGLTSATLAIAGQSLGAGQIGRLPEVWRAALREGFMATLVGAVLLTFLAPPALHLFSPDPVVVASGAGYLRIAALVLFAYAFLFVTTSLLQAVQQPLYALWIGLYRQIAAPLALYPLLAERFGPAGLWFGIGLVTWSAGLFTLWWGRRALRRITAGAPV